MTGFRKKLSTADTLLEFCSAADNAKKSSQTLLAAFLDERRAFDSVTAQAVVNQLQQIKVGGRTIRFITNFLQERIMQIRLGTVRSITESCTLGLPQGSILSPVLFNIVMAGLTYALPLSSPSLHVSIYADDVTIWTTGRRLPSLTKNLQRALTSTQTDLAKAGLTISPEKPTYMKLLLQFDRLSKSRAGKEIIKRLEQHSSSRFINLFRTFKRLTKPEQQEPSLRTPWELPNIYCETTVPKLRKKKNISPIAAKAIALDFIQEGYSRHTKVFTDGSVNRSTASSSSAYCIPSLGISWNGRILGQGSSTTAEQIAIFHAAKALAALPPQPVVILCDSRAALARLQHPKPEDTLSWNIRDVVEALENYSFSITMQWLPSLVGIPGNEQANNLASEAHQQDPCIKAPLDPKATRHSITAYFEDVRIRALGVIGQDKPKCPPKGLPRRKSTALHRIRTGSAFTPAFLHKIGRADSP
ncbi:uncharacterized protein LOC135389713 [Ornithodoros turicata]|uniref:uncharacterized protein LOC135389713 n=1 Tax=Ornithodoros turicata TaxID=34597 RepID=UPI003139C635